MNAVEELLGEALRARAGQRTATELPDAMQRVRHRIRRQRRRRATGGAVAATLASVVLVLAVPGVLDGGNRGKHHTGLVQPVAPTQVPDLVQGWNQLYRDAIRQYPVKGAVAKVSEPSAAGHGIRLRAWLAVEPSYQSGAPLLCHAYVLGAGGGGSGCWPGLPASVSKSARGFIKTGSTESASDGEIAFGVADDRVRSVAVLLENGVELPGSLVAIDGVAVKFWQVRAPKVGSAKAIVFNGEVQEPFGARIALHPESTQVRCRDGDRLPDDALEVASYGTERLAASFRRGCVGFWIGGYAKGRQLLDVQHTHQDGWSRFASNRWWYGVAEVSTTRVELRLRDGTRLRARLVRPGWNGTAVVLYVGDLAWKQDLKDSTVLGYGADGRVLWRR